MAEIEVAGPEVERSDEVLTPAALGFVVELHRRFDGRRCELLAQRAERRAEIVATGRLDWLPHTREVRESQWSVPPPPADLTDRRTEITGPTERKMTINALNSGARVWLADHEDANAPTWFNMVAGQVNLIDAVERRISFASPDGKEYDL